MGIGVAVAVLGYFGCAAALSRYLQSGDLRERISAKTGGELGVPSGFLPFEWRGLSVYSEGFLAQAPPERALTELRARNVWARCNLQELWQRRWRVEKLTVEHLQAAFGKPAAAQLVDALSRSPELQPPDKSEAPIKLEIIEFAVARTDLFWGDPKKSGGEFRDVATTYWPDRKNLIVHGHAGTFQQSGFPKAMVRELKLYYERPTLRVDEATLTLGGMSSVAITGAFQFGEQAEMDLRLNFQRCPVHPFLSAAWRAKFDGSFESETRLVKRLGEEESASAAGKIAFLEAVIKNIEALKKVAAFTGEPGFRVLKLQTLSGTYRWDAPTLTVENLALESRGLLRVEGGFVVRGKTVSGTFKLGTTAEVLESFPGARERVFTEQRGGYFWTPVKVQGPLEHPRDDLKPRLVAAAEAHFAKAFLVPLLKPGTEVVKKIRELF